jgi:hypothetical protein
VDSLSLNTNLNIPHAPFSMSTNIDSNAFKSEQHSPTVRETSRSGSLGANFSNIDLSALGLVQTNQSVDSIESNAFPMFDPSSGVDSQDPWSTFPSSDSLVFPNNNPFGAWATTFDASTLVQPALTAGSSCTQSDIDEIPPTDEMYNFTMPSIAEDFDLNDATADGNNVNRRSLPPNFFGNTDFTTAFSENWQQLDDAPEQSFDANKAKSPMHIFNVANGDSWPTPTMTNTAHRGTLPTGRPQSHSIGPGSAPNEDVIKQLFPDIDVTTTFGSVPSPGDLAFMAMKRFGDGLPADDRTSAPIDFTTDESTAMTSQPWTDGSMPLVNDVFTGAYNLDQDFPISDFSNSWSGNQ